MTHLYMQKSRVSNLDQQFFIYTLYKKKLERFFLRIHKYNLLEINLVSTVYVK